MSDQDLTYDFIIVGSGAASVPAALAMKERGKRALVIEKQNVVGGSSAFSGGVLWIPNNDHLNAAGGNDSHERARAYLDGLIGEPIPGSTIARRDAFIKEGPQMLRFLERHGMKFLHANWPDYYDSRPGGIALGRSLVAPLFDVNELGAWKDKLAVFPMFAGLPMGSQDGAALSTMKTTWRGRMVAAKLGLRILENKILGKTLRGSGNALQGRLLQIALREQINYWTGTPVKGFIHDNRVSGVIVEREGRQVEVRATCGVLINAGGFSHNLAMREQYQPKPASTKWTASNPGDTGEMIQAAQALGAAIDCMNESWWTPGTFKPDGTFMGFHVPNDVAKPHSIVVDGNGNRFANEAGAYMEFGQRMYAAGAVPAYVILESRNRSRYPFGMMPPGVTSRELLDCGYIRRFDSLDALARGCGIDPAGLARTIERFNGFCATGVDPDFGRGASAYNCWAGDVSHKPNACLGAIEKPPFYALELQPADVGTAGGVVTDEFARVLRADGSVIEGLYATGNCTASVMGRCYPGAGASIGPSMTFGYIAARHAGQ
ncbi:MAG: FAD-dependent oxidoreductase [Gammaproteobacteria bacterium]